MPDVPAKPRQTPFRRRVPLELTAAELELLEEAEARFGTKRATLVAGLEALARLAALENQLAQATSMCERAGERTEELQRKIERLAKELEKSKAEAASAKRGKKSAERKGEEAGTQVDDFAAALRHEQDARRQLEDELADVEAELFDALRCPRCGAWAPPKDWATQADGAREYVYHRPCGYHAGGLLDPTSVFGFRAS
jgi:DNA repair exonuclease SbcCD ATPase subunit